MKKIQNERGDDFKGDEELDGFDAFLSQRLTKNQTYIDDDNFAASVLARLPAKKKLSRLHEWIILAAPLIIISALVLSQFNVIALVIKMWTWLFVVDTANFVQVSLVIGFTVLASISLWLAKQFRLF